MIYLKQFTETANVGDSLSSAIVSSVLDCEIQIIGDAPVSEPNLIAIGSIAHWCDQHSVLWGCGFINGNMRSQRPHSVLAVRGKLTRDMLWREGIQCPETLGDPGLLAPDLFSPAATKTYELGVVPHYVDLQSPFVERCRREGIVVIDPMGPIDAYIAKLTACRRIISSSLHGIVIAHAYGIPAAWVTISDRVHGNGFKFRDYFSSLSIGSSDSKTLRADDEKIATMSLACFDPGLNGLPDRDALRSTLLAYGSKLGDRAAA